jgi:Flp pilus assembly protein TadD
MSGDTVTLFSDPGFAFRFPDDLGKLWDPESGQGLMMDGPSETDPGYEHVPVLRTAVVDSGVLSDHPAIRRTLEASVDLVGGGTEDQFGHGTFVALSIFGGYPETRIRLLSVKVIDQSGLGRERDIVRGIEWAIQQDVDVINLSLGIERSRCRGKCKVCKATKRAIANGIIVFAAGGNTIGSVACPARLAIQGQPGIFARVLVEAAQTTQVIFEGKALSTQSYTNVLKPMAETTAEFQAASDLLRAGRLEDALIAFRPLIQSKQPYERSVAAFNVGIILDRLGDADNALTAYEQAIALGQESAAYYVADAAYNLGELRERLGDSEGAEEAYRLAAGSFLNEYRQSLGKFKLARMLFLRQSFEEAEQIAQSIADSGRTDLAPKAEVLLGLIAEDTGREELAKERYRAAIAMGDEESAMIAQQNLALLQSS